MDYTEFHKIARRKVRRKKWFHRHFALFIAGAIIIAVLGSPYSSWWNVFRDQIETPTPIWGAVVLFHYLLVYGFPITGALSGRWEEKEMKKELNKLYSTNPVDEEDYQGMTFEDRLELKELDRLKSKWESDQYV